MKKSEIWMEWKGIKNEKLDGDQAGTMAKYKSPVIPNWKLRKDGEGCWGQA